MMKRMMMMKEVVVCRLVGDLFFQSLGCHGLGSRTEMMARKNKREKGKEENEEKKEKQE